METSTTRMEAFSDGVFAIAATLLVLEFSISHAQQSPPLGTQLLHLWPAYLTYLTSFVTIGIIWMNHHHAVSLLGRTDRTFMFINILLLVIVAYMPFPTRLVGDYLRHGKGEGAAALDYAATFVLMSVVFNGWWRYASGGRRLIAEAVPDSAVRAISRAFNPGVFMYGAVFVIAFFSPLAAVVLTFAIAVFYLPSAALFDRGG